MTLTTLALARYERGMRRPRTRAWYLAMALRLTTAALWILQREDGVAAHSRARRLLDRAEDCRHRAQRAA